MKNLITSTLLTLLAASAAYAGWSQPVRISEPGGGYYPQIIAQGDTLHMAFTLTGARERLCYLRSTDGGDSWGQQLMISDTLYSGAPSQPRLILGGSRLMAIWRVYVIHGPYHENLGYNTSTNNGRTWLTPRLVLANNLEGGFVYAASGETSIVNIMATCPLTDTLTFYNIRSTNFGQSWYYPQEIFRALQSGVPDQAGFGDYVYFAWDGRFDMAHKWEIRYIKSTNGGINWSANIVLSDADQYHSQAPSICVDSFNHVGVSWMDYEYSPYMMTGDILSRQSLDSGMTWNNKEQISFNHFALGANDIAMNGDTVHIVWEDASQGLIHRSIYYTRSTDDGATWSEPYWIDGTLDDSADPAIALSNGRVYVVWTDGRANPDTNIIGGLYISRWDPEPDAINEEGDILPERMSLTAYPNPFNSSVTITYSRMKGGEINIYDIQGKLLRTFKIDGGANGKIIWDATDALGNKVSSGEYFLKAGTNQNSQSIRLLYLK
jgi:hypothetical protein